jgi:hypothetical protein
MGRIDQSIDARTETVAKAARVPHATQYVARCTPRCTLQVARTHKRAVPRGHARVDRVRRVVRQVQVRREAVAIAEEPDKLCTHESKSPLKIMCALARPLACARAEAVDLTSMDTRTHARAHPTAPVPTVAHRAYQHVCLPAGTRSPGPTPNTRQYPHTSTAGDIRQHPHSTYIPARARR